MADLTLNKMFVLVPKGLGTTVASIKEASKTSNKIYFLEEYNQIVAKGTVYGVDPVSSNNLTTLVNSLGANVAEDGTVSFDWTGFNYGKNQEGENPADTLLKVLKTIDATLADIVTRVTKLENGIANSKTLKWVNNNVIEFSGSIKYVPAAGGVAAHIALVDEDNKTELSTVAVSDIVGNGVLKDSSYDAATGYLTLIFAQADGTDKTVRVDLRAMLDINDMSVAPDSQEYLNVELGAADAEGNSQAVFSVDVQNLSVTKGIAGEYNAEGAQTKAPVHGVLSGVDKSLADGGDVALKVKDYVDGEIAIEVARADAKVLAAIKGLDKTSSTVDGTNVHVAYKEEDGIVTIESVVEDYATVTRKATSSVAGTPAADASITVTPGDEDKLVKAKDLKAVADYAADKVTEEAHRVDKKIADLDVTETPVSESGEGAINFKYSEDGGIVTIGNLSATYSVHTPETGGNPSKISTGIVSGTVLNSVLADMWETYKA